MDLHLLTFRRTKVNKFHPVHVTAFRWSYEWPPFSRLFRPHLAKTTTNCIYFTPRICAGLSQNSINANHRSRSSYPSTIHQPRCACNTSRNLRSVNAPTNLIDFDGHGRTIQRQNNGNERNATDKRSIDAIDMRGRVFCCCRPENGVTHI